MEYPSVSNINEANLYRTRYLLSRYHQFAAQSGTVADIQVSRAVLDILSFHFMYRNVYTQEDRELINRCGILLIPAIDCYLEEIKNYPYEIVKIVYPVLYHYYFSPDGKAVDYAQLQMRLQEENLSLSEEDLRIWLRRGERTFSTLLFPNPLLAAVSLWD